MAHRRPRSSSPNLAESSIAEGNNKHQVSFDISEEILPEMSNIYSEILCPICYQIINDAYITHCGHTFCHQCILNSIDKFKNCPKCSNTVLSEQIHQNILLNELISKCKINNSLTILEKKPLSENLKNYVLAESKNLSLTEINHMIEILLQYKKKIEAQNTSAQNTLLVEFFKKLLKKKEEEKFKISEEINIIKQDLQFAQKHTSRTNQFKMKNYFTSLDSTESSILFTSIEETDNTIEMNTQLHNNVSKLDTHFADFVSSYFEMHSNNTLTNIIPQSSEIDDNLKILKYKHFDLNSFRQILSKCCQYSSFRCKASINSASEDYIASNIISSVVFNKECSHFAIGGVSKKIKVYDYNLMETNLNAFQYPLTQIALSNKISCLSWNALHRNVLASSDYEGVVNIWDVDTGIRSRCFGEHEKRCWSIDFSEIDPSLIISGADDNKVKLWSIKENHSIVTLETKANVCSVKFNPTNSYHLAFGSADHYIYYYDIRNLKHNLCIFKGHKKAVSYVKFLNSNEIISASTDSQLKYWNINSPTICLRSFKGHLNEKNFVGLTVDRDYIACGSEDNSIYVYYKGISKQLFNYKISVIEKIKNTERLSEMNDFVSAVCWKKESEIIIAANSKGLIKVLELI